MMRLRTTTKEKNGVIKTRQIFESLNEQEARAETKSTQIRKKSKNRESVIIPGLNSSSS